MAGESAEEDGEESNTSLLVVGIGVVLVLIGVGIAIGASLSAINAMQAADAGVQTEGTVVSTNITQEYEDEGSSSTDDDGGGSDTERVYYAQVTYNYTVDGETYTSSTHKVPPLVTEPGGKEFESRSEAESYLSRYEPGDSLTVYHMPDEPSESYFEEPDYSLGELALPFVFGTPFAGVGVLIALYGLGRIGGNWGKEGSDEVWTAEDDESLEDEREP